MLEIHPSPIRVSTAAAHKLPRTLLLTLLIVFICSGLLNRDLWSSEETRTLGEVLSLASGDWTSMLFPFASGEVITEHGPLVGWIGAIAVRWLGAWISPLTALRLTSLMWFTITTACIWYGTWFLARRHQAQPLVPAFGQTAAAYRDYGRLVADSATLFFVSLFGLVIRSHEPTYQTAELALAACAYFGCAWSLTRPYWGAALCGISSGLLILTSNLLVGLSVLVGCLFAHIAVHGIGRLDRKLITATVTALLTFSLWPVSAYLIAGEVSSDYFSLWARSQTALFGLINPDQIAWFVKHFMWYLCPAWPFAFWALWSWRRSLMVTHIALPTAFCSAWLLGCICSDNISAETLLSVMIAPMCTLSAFGLMASSRNGKSLLECFCVAVFTLALAGVWIYWIAWSLGFPPKMHHSIARLAAVGFQAHLHWLPVAVCVALLGFWLVLCAQRLKRRPTVFWQGPWLSATGLTVLWITVLSLFGPVIDSNRTYAHIAQEMRSVLQVHHFVPAVDCVRAEGLTLAERTAISWYAGAVMTASTSESCRFYIERATQGQSNLREGTWIEAYRPRSKIRFRVGLMAPIVP